MLFRKKQLSLLIFGRTAVFGGFILKPLTKPNGYDKINYRRGLSRKARPFILMPAYAKVCLQKSLLMQKA
jgi:hypothetical protein